MTTRDSKKLEETKLEGVLRAEVNLNYDSDIALQNGLNFLDAIAEISPNQAQLPVIVCSNNIKTYMKDALREIEQESLYIDSLEKFLTWLCISWQLSNTTEETTVKNGFSFLEENPNGAQVKFSISLPLDYRTALKKNIVCAAYESPYEDSLFYSFPNRLSLLLDTEVIYSNNNSSEVNNNSQIGN